MIGKYLEIHKMFSIKQTNCAVTTANDHGHIHKTPVKRRQTTHLQYHNIINNVDMKMASLTSN